MIWGEILITEPQGLHTLKNIFGAEATKFMRFKCVTADL